MKKILILTGFNPVTFTGGIETFTNALIRLLKASGVDSDIVCASDFSNTYKLNNEFLGQVYAAGRSLLSQHPDRYEFVISNGYYGGGYFPKKLKSFTIFHSTHTGYAEATRDVVPLSTYLEIRHIIGEILEQCAATNAKIIAVSNSVKSELYRYYGIKEIEVIPNPVDTDFFFRLHDREDLRNKYGIPCNQKVGLFVGRWEMSKGRDIVEKTINQLSDFFWVIVTSSGGETSPPEGKNILTLNRLDRIQMREIHSLSDFMLFPSQYEGFGMAAAEAMASGLPVIGRPVGFLEEIYSGAPFSFMSIHATLPDINEIVSTIKDSIHKLFSDEDLYKEISEKGRDIILKNYNLTTWHKQMKEILCLN